MIFDLRPAPLAEVRALCEQHHGYQSAGGLATYSFGVYERSLPTNSFNYDNYFVGRLVAGYTWQPPAPGAAKSVCPEAPHAVLALSRMVAVPKTERELKHVSKPLMEQMHELIDRTRWPVLITYSDEGEGHTGYVYQCSGWEKTSRALVKKYLDGEGRRVSPYSNGEYAKRQGVARAGATWIQRWEHWVCQRGYADAWLKTHGWARIAIPGKKWRSGNPAYRYERFA